MYNQTSFIAIMQQAIKKPPVTEILLDHSYARGWRCEANYDQLLSFGQVAIKWFHRQHDSGDWRWFLLKPILNHKSIARTVMECCLACGSFCFLFCGFFPLYQRLFTGIDARFNKKESQVLVVPGFHYFHCLNCILR